MTDDRDAVAKPQKEAPSRWIDSAHWRVTVLHGCAGIDMSRAPLLGHLDPGEQWGPEYGPVELFHVDSSLVMRTYESPQPNKSFPGVKIMDGAWIQEPVDHREIHNPAIRFDDGAIRLQGTETGPDGVAYNALWIVEPMQSGG